MRRRRIVGFGQRAAGDDGVGLEVVEELRRRGVGAEVELYSLSSAFELVELLEPESRVVVVDAVLSPPAGRVLLLKPAALEREATQVSSHGFGVAKALELAAALHAGPIAEVWVVGVTIERPEGYRVGLSPEVAAQVSFAAERALELVKRG